MQTFMPRNDYKFSAQELDDKRLGKQRVEAWQIYKALRGDYNKTGAWVNHPATRMWAGCEQALIHYGMVICAEWEERGFKDTLYERFDYEFKDNFNYQEPWWVNNELLNMTHQSNLMRKDSSYYAFDVPDNMPYVWPLPDTEAFRLGTFKNGDNLTMFKGNNVYLTSKQIAELLGISPKTISAYKARGQMPKPDKEYGRTPLWSYDTIEKWRGEIHTPVVPIK